MGKRILTLLFLLIFFTDEKFFFSIPNIDWRYSMILLCAVFYFGSKRYQNIKYDFKQFLVSYEVMLLLSALNVYRMEVSSIDTILRSYILLMPIVLYIPMANMGIRYGVFSLVKPMIWFALGVSIYSLLHSLGFLDIINVDFLSEREGMMRSFIGTYAMILGTLIQVWMVLFVRHSRKIRLLIGATVTFMALVWVNQSRSVIFATFGAMMVLVYYRYAYMLRKAGSIGRLAKLTVAVGVMFYAYQYVNEAIKSSLAINEASSVIRIEAYQYYFTKFLQYPFLGYGLTNVNELINDGIASRLYVDDIGVVGYIAQTGLLGVLCVFFFVKNYIDAMRKIAGMEQYLFISFAAILILLLPFNSLLSTDSTIIYVVYILALISSITYQYGKNS